jgi:sodium transport system permease protein
VKTTSRIIKKDLLYTMRDKRTAILTILMPCLFLGAYAFFANGMLTVEEGAEFGAKLAKLIILMLIAMILFLSVLTSSLELGVGEKERGTLNATLQTGVSRYHILSCKVAALLLEGLLTLAIMNVTILVLRFVPGNLFYGNGLFSWSELLGIDLLMVGCVLLFSMVELSVSMNVRSYKEGQILSLPLMVLILGSFAYVLSSFSDGGSVSGVMSAIPLMNISTMCANLVSGSFSFPFVAIFLVSNGVLAALAVMLTARRLNRR